jgi:multicomponent Na+:H+ antiporter subunit D
MIGVPPTAGIVSKWWLTKTAGESGAYVVMGVLLASTLLNAAYFLPIVWRAFFRRGPDDDAGVREAPWPCVVALSVTAACTVALFFAPDVFLSLAERVTEGALSVGEAVGSSGGAR